MPERVRTVLFDLDGTLADTAPDLAYALNTLRDEEGLPPLPYAQIRPVVSHGGSAMVKLGFGGAPDEPVFVARRQRFLDIYRQNLTRETRLFPGMDAVLAVLTERAMNWGVVTNKPAWLTDPLLEELGLSTAAACIVSGDTTPQRKPHPAPMFYACNLAGSVAAECVYVGDAQRDIEAGRRAGMHTLVALFGYLGAEDAPATWGADALLQHPLDIVRWLDAHDA